ncbi:RDD family protein [Streptomyces marispadix]|uniref:RDD family protein n=1 Tax=Streptomyces marispadix TaxID=2922868 RepID=A0ABS9SX36_9ACTN|nr:RDD family protein [Streptomyces marispadix]MCH6160611.1 RDD family protein [Streptomyces marispadix]
MSELVTGDAVVLGLRPARLPTRALAVFIDLVLAWAVYLAVSLALLTAVASLDEAAVAAVQVALFLLVLVGVPVAVETLSRGRSVGKVLCGLRVLREDGGPVRFRHALVRGAIGVIEIQVFFGVVACAASLVSARGRRLGDVFAGTLVVRERVPEPSGAPAPPPPAWLAGSFGELDLSRVPAGLWLAVRQYLLRAGQLDEVVSRSMAERLASDLVSCTGVPAPYGVPAATYLAGIVAERQAREAQRTFGTRGDGGAPGAVGGAVAERGPVSAAAGAGSGVGGGGSDGHPWAPVSGAVAGAVAGAAAETPGGTVASDGAVASGSAPAGGRESAGERARTTGFVPPS